VNYEYGVTGEVDFHLDESLDKFVMFGSGRFAPLKDQRNEVGIVANYGNIKIKIYSKTKQAALSQIYRPKEKEMVRVEFKEDRLSRSMPCRTVEEFGKPSTWDMMDEKLKDNFRKVLFIDPNLNGSTLKDRVIIQRADYFNIVDLARRDARAYRQFRDKYNILAIDSIGGVMRELNRLLSP